jgi:hypothetical protein
MQAGPPAVKERLDLLLLGHEGSSESTVSLIVNLPVIPGTAGVESAHVN